MIILIIMPAFIFRKKNVYSFRTKVGPSSVYTCVRMYVRTVVMCLVNASPPKLLDVATATLQVHRSHDIKGNEQHFV